MNRNNIQQGSALYSLPDEQLFYEVSGPVSQIRPSEIFQQQGFIFAPFDHTKLPIYHISGQPRLTSLEDHHFPSLRKTSYPDHEPVSRESYQKMFDECMNRLEKGEVDKIVLSVREIEEKNLPDIPYFLSQLRDAYPHAFIFAFYMPDQEFWIGATPELLLDTQYPFQRTVALAGTLTDAPRLEDWGAKEREEHRFVEIFVEEKLEGKPYKKEGPQPIQAGPVHHLCTQYYIHMESAPVNPVELHPSPALSGFPVPGIFSHIRGVEPHDRRYYTGFLGPIWNDGHSKFFINLRCLEIFEKEVALYAGGGMTKDSDPDIEWAEINHKLSTLRTKFLKDEKV